MLSRRIWLFFSASRFNIIVLCRQTYACDVHDFRKHTNNMFVQCAKLLLHLQRSPTTYFNICLLFLYSMCCIKLISMASLRHAYVVGKFPVKLGQSLTVFIAEAHCVAVVAARNGQIRTFVEIAVTFLRQRCAA